MNVFIIQKIVYVDYMDLSCFQFTGCSLHPFFPWKSGPFNWLGEAYKVGRGHGAKSMASWRLGLEVSKPPP